MKRSLLHPTVVRHPAQCDHRAMVVRVLWRVLRDVIGACLGVGLVWLLISLAAPAAHAQSLDELARRVPDTDPRVNAARRQWQAAQADADLTRATYGTKVSVFSDVGRTTGAIGSSSDMGVRLRHTLVDWGKSALDVERAQAKVAEAEARVGAEVYTQWQELTGLYVEQLRLQAALVLSDEYLGGLDALREAAATIASYDRGRRFDLEQILARMQLARVQRGQREQALAEGQERLRTLLALPQVKAEWPGQEVLGTLPAMGALEDGLRQHPTVRRAQAAADQARLESSLAERERQPNVNLVVSRGSRDALGRFQALSVTDVRVQAEWSALDAGMASARARSASAQAQAQMEQVEVALREVRSGWREQLTRRLAIEQRMPSMAVQVETARRLRGDFREQFIAGRRTLTDLLAAEADFFSARLTLSDERHEALASGLREFIVSGRAAERWGGMEVGPGASAAAPVARPAQVPMAAPGAAPVAEPVTAPVAAPVVTPVAMPDPAEPAPAR